jgi:predicted RNA polymerase sigma factor
MGIGGNGKADLRERITRALRLGRVTEALALYELLERQKPDEPRWSRRKADLLHRMGRDHAAAIAYQRAADLYAAKGFEARAAATSRLMHQIKPC